MRASGALVAALFVAGCGHDQTSLLVTVAYDDVNHHPGALLVTIASPSQTLRMNTRVSGSGGRPLKSGDSFAVLLADSLDGETVTVAIDTEGDIVQLHGSGQQTVHRDRVAAITVPLGVPGADGGIDGAADQGAASQADLAAAADLGCTPSTSCAAGVETTTCGASTSMRSCAWGCRGNACLGPDDCNSPVDISSGGLFADSTAGYHDDATGSCGGQGGVDAVFTLGLNQWRTVTIDTSGSSYDTILYTRLSCNDPLSELPLAGPCGAATAFGGMCNDNAPGLFNGASKLVECNLPPGIPYFTWLDGKGAGGPYHLNVQLGAPASLNDCLGAGNLLDGNNRSFSASTVGHVKWFNASNCSNAPDNGGGSPDAIFFLATNSTKSITVSTSQAFPRHLLYARAACMGADLGCVYSGNSTAATLALPNQPAGLYYIIVDGTGGASGAFTLTVNAQ